MADIKLLHEARATLGLSEMDIAQLTGVPRAEIASWTATIPPEHVDAVAPLCYVGQFMREWFLEPHIPELVRKPVAGLNGKSVLQAMRENGSAYVVGYLSSLFELPTF